MQVGFGAGLLGFTPSGSNPTPIIAGVLQDVSLKLSGEVKKLYGQNRYPASVAEGEASITGTAKSAQFYGSFIKQALAGSTIGTGMTIGAIGEAATIPGTPYQVTVTNSATFSADLGVYNYSQSKPMTRVASSPATGQYSVSAGVYTFAAADAGNLLSISYTYTSASGQTVTLNNALMGVANTFTCHLFNQYDGKSSGIKLYSVIIPGFDWAMKNNDFTSLSVNFEGMADSANRVLEFYTSE